MEDGSLKRIVNRTLGIWHIAEAVVRLTIIDARVAEIAKLERSCKNALLEIGKLEIQAASGDSIKARAAKARAAAFLVMYRVSSNRLSELQTKVSPE
jgi:hypothetical protein